MDFPKRPSVKEEHYQTMEDVGRQLIELGQRLLGMTEAHEEMSKSVKKAKPKKKHKGLKDDLVTDTEKAFGGKTSTEKLMLSILKD